MQAVAMNINGDRAVFYKCRFLGSQDTLLDDIGLHYFYQCYIEGMIDFICGNARSLYQVHYHLNFLNFTICRNWDNSRKFS